MSFSSLNGMLASALAGLDLPPASFNASGMAAVSMAGLKVALEYTEKDGCLHIYCSAASLPEEPDHAFYELILQKNLFGAELGGGHLGLYAPTRTLIFSLDLDIDALDGSRLSNALRRFTEQATELISELEQHTHESVQNLDSTMFMGNMLWV